MTTIHTWRPWSLAAALLLIAGIATGCGGDACEDYCAGAQGCENAEFAQGDQCVSGCREAIEYMDGQGCGSEYEDMLSCAADADDVCNPVECVSEALAYVGCANTD